MKFISTRSMIKRSISSLIVSITALAATAFAQTNVDTSFSAVPSKTIPTGTSIQQVVQPDGKVVVYGPRMVVGGIAGGEIVRLNVDGTVDNGFSYCSCGITYINNVMLASDGKLLVGGGDVGYGRIIRLNIDGSLDTTFSVSRPGWQPGNGAATIIVDAIQPDGKVMATFRTSYQGFVAYSLYRFNADGTEDTSFSPIGIASGSPMNASVRIRLLPDGRFYLGTTAGTFGSTSSLTRRISTGAVDPTWETPNFSSNGFPTRTSISDIDVGTDGAVYIAGTWDAVNGLDRKYLVRLMPAGNVDMTFNGPAVVSGTGVEVLPNGKILYSANTDIANVYKLFRLNADGTSDGTYVQDPAILNIQSTWGIDGMQRTVFYASTASGSRLVRLNSNGGLDNTYNPAFEGYGSVNALTRQSDGKILVAGVFTQMNGVARANMARVNADGSLDTTFNAGSGFDTPPSTLLLQADGKSIAIGEFTTFNGAFVSGIVRLNTDGSRDNTFSIDVVGPVRSGVIRPDGKIYLVGSFWSVNGFSRTGAALINSDGSNDNSFIPILGSPSSVYAVALQNDGKVMIGGSFSGVNGFNRSNFSRLNPDGSLDQSFTANIGGGVGRIWPQADGKFMIGVQLQPSVLDRRNADGSDDTTFTQGTITTNSSSDIDIRNLITLPDGSYLVSGRFDVAGVSRPNIARLAPSGAVDILFPTAGANGRVNSMINDGAGKVIIGGEFSSVFGVTKAGIARLNIAPYRVNTPYDFDGDGRADFTVFRPSTNQWYELFLNTNSYEASAFGLPGDIPVPADFDGDGKTDEAMFRPSTGDWWYQSSINGAHLSRHYGTAGDIPRPGDLDLDGKADFIVFRPSTNQWYRVGTSVGELPAYSFGLSGDQPVIGDFDGDGKVDPAIFRPSTGDWWYAASSAGNQHRAAHWGAAGDIPTPADFDGDKKTDIAVYRPSTGVWYIYNSSNLSFTILPFGISEDRPVVADYDGDGKADIALFRPSTGIWYLLRSTAGFTGLQWGVSSDVAAPAAFNP